MNCKGLSESLLLIACLGLVITCMYVMTRESNDVSWMNFFSDNQRLNSLQSSYLFCLEILVTELQIREGNDDNPKIIFLISQRKYLL